MWMDRNLLYPIAFTVQAVIRLRVWLRVCVHKRACESTVLSVNLIPVSVSDLPVPAPGCHIFWLCQLITLTIHNSLSPSPLVKTYLFHKSFPSLTLFRPREWLHGHMKGPFLPSISVFCFLFSSLLFWFFLVPGGNNNNNNNEFTKRTFCTEKHDETPN